MVAASVEKALTTKKEMDNGGVGECQQFHCPIPHRQVEVSPYESGRIYKVRHRVADAIIDIEGRRQEQ